MKFQHVIRLKHNARVFVMEDSFERVAWFQAKLGTNLVGVYKDTELAKQRMYHLDPFSIDAIFLDHDLGYDPRHCETTIQFARWLGEVTQYDQTYNRRIVIHSYNESGAKNLRSLLPGSTILRYGSFDLKVCRYPACHDGELGGARCPDCTP